MRSRSFGPRLLVAAVALVALGAAAPRTGISDPTKVVKPAPLPLQPVGTAFVDPVFGTTFRRLTGRSPGGFGTQIYSQLQAFSPDDAMVLLIENGAYVVRRTADLSRVRGFDTADWNAPRWQPARPNAIVHFDSNANTDVTVQETDVDTGVTTDVFRFPTPYRTVAGNQSFDELTQDGRWMSGTVVRRDGAGVIFALDLRRGRLGAVLPIPDLYGGPCAPDPTYGQVWPDWVGMSPLGDYLVVQWTRDGTTRCSGLETFDPRTGAFVGRVYDGHQHGDLGVDTDGVTEFFMTFELYHPSGRPALGVRLLPGTATVAEPRYLTVLDWGNGEHISCRGPDGVCVITAGVWRKNGWTAFEGEVFLQYTDGRVLRLAHHRSSSCGYWVQPRATMSRDGRYVLFASDWSYGTGTTGCAGGASLGRGDAYLIDLSAA